MPDRDVAAFDRRARRYERSWVAYGAAGAIVQAAAREPLHSEAALRRGLRDVRAQRLRSGLGEALAILTARKEP